VRHLLDHVQGATLVQVALIRREGSRFRMLETIRELAEELFMSSSGAADESASGALRASGARLHRRR
jgi:hypothetical protein